MMGWPLRQQWITGHRTHCGLHVLALWQETHCWGQNNVMYKMFCWLQELPIIQEILKRHLLSWRRTVCHRRHCGEKEFCLGEKSLQTCYWDEEKPLQKILWGKVTPSGMTENSLCLLRWRGDACYSRYCGEQELRLKQRTLKICLLRWRETVTEDTMGTASPSGMT